MTDKSKPTEAEYAALVCEWLDSNGWEVYTEVKHHDCRADIVAMNGEASLIVECKARPCMEVVSQAHRWIGWSDMVAIAVPPLKGRRLNRVDYEGHWIDLCKLYGIGFFRTTITDEYDYSGDPQNPVEIRKGVCELLAVPEWQKSIYPSRKDMIPESLHDEQRLGGEYAAGTNGEYFTPFKRTKKLVIQYVAAHPGCTAREIAEGIEHHWGDNGAAGSRLRVRIVDWNLFEGSITWRRSVLNRYTFFPAGVNAPGPEIVLDK